MLTLAGCVGGISSDDVTPTTSEPEGDGLPEEIPATATILEYGELSSTEKQAFDGVKSEGSVTVYQTYAWGTPERSYTAETLASAWPGELATPGDAAGESKVRYLTKNGTYYEVRFASGGYEQVDGPQIKQIEKPGNQSVIDLNNESGREFEFLRHTINVTEGDGFARGLVDVPVGGGDILAYQGQYYKVEYVRVYDYEPYQITIAEVGS